MNASDTLDTIESRGVDIWVKARHPKIILGVSDGDKVADLGHLIRDHKPAIAKMLDRRERMRALDADPAWQEAMASKLPATCVGHPDRDVYRYAENGSPLCEECAWKYDDALAKEAHAVATQGALFGD